MESKLMSMVQFILEIDWLTTKEFCDKYKVPLPYYTGDVKTSSDLFLQIDAIKQRLFVAHAKLLNKEISFPLLKSKFGFECMGVVAGNEKFKKDKYEITNDEFGFWLEPYDSVDGKRVHKVEDLVGLDLTYSFSS